MYISLLSIASSSVCVILYEKIGRGKGRIGKYDADMSKYHNVARKDRTRVR